MRRSAAGAGGRVATRLDDPDVIRREYATEEGLRTRARVYAGIAGPDAWDVVVSEIADARPRRVLDAGCGFGDLAVRLREELGVDVVAVDISPRMVELARERGVEAHVADVQELPFADGEFDCVTANWMLYHVPDLDLGISELARVLGPRGRLVAATNGLRHLEELWSLVGRNRADEPVRFFAETGEPFLRRHFQRAERRDVRSEVTFRDGAAVREYISSLVAQRHRAALVPELDAPLVATRWNTVFVAWKAA